MFRSTGKKLLVALALILTVAAALPALEHLDRPHLLSGTIHVGPDQAIRSIQLAIDLAKEGSTILVHGGDYHENLVVSKGLTITSAPGETSRLVLDGPVNGWFGIEDTMMRITSNSKVIVKDLVFNVLNDTYDDAAIKVQYGTSHEISNNTIYGGYQGIWVHGGDATIDLGVEDIHIHDNHIYNVSGHAIYLQRTWGKVEHNMINSSGDGIMVAFEWTEPNEYAGGFIAENTIENCSAGLNFVSSTVFNYAGNKVKHCDIGEVLNSSDQHSRENTFIDCDVGTLVRNGSTPVLRSNTYDGCEVPVEIDRCQGARLYGNGMTGTTIGVRPIWGTLDQLNHSIASNNTIDGRAVFYSFGERGVTRDLNGCGQVFIANSTGSTYSLTGPSPAVVTIVGSRDVDLSGSRIDTGLEIIGSEGVTAEGLDLEYNGAWELHRGIKMSDSSMSLYNSSVKAELSGIELEGSNLDIFNVSGHFSMVLDADSTVHRYSFIGMSVLFEDGTSPVEGAEFKVTRDAVTVMSTPLFGGKAGRTDTNGKAGPFWLLDRSQAGTAVKAHATTIRVNVTADRSWETIREVNTTNDHIERFVTSDIRAPSAPGNLRTRTVEDGIGLQWDANTDDTVSYRVYRTDGSNTTLISEPTGTSYTDTNIPNGSSARFFVTAVDEVGLESLPSAEVEGVSVDRVAPQPPTSLKLVNIAGGSVTLSWSRSPSQDVVLYEVYVVNEAQGQPLVPVRQVGTTEGTTFIVTGLSEKEKILSVRAVDDANLRSIFCDPVDLGSQDLTWPVISNLKWNYGAVRVSISFSTDVPTRGDVFIGTDTADLEAGGLDVLSSEHLFEIHDLTPRTTYYFYVTAAEPSGNSATDDNNGALYTFTTYASESFLRVVLNDEDGEPITGATVTAEGPTGTVQVIEVEPGTYKAYLIPGNWTVTVASSDHETVEPFQFWIGPGEWVNRTLELKSIGWAEAVLTVIVLDENDVPIEGASVEVNGRVFTSGPDGRADLGTLATNITYKLKVKAKGYKDLEQDVTVGSKKKEQSVTVHLIKAGTTKETPRWPVVLVAAIIALLLLAIVVVILFVMRKRSSEKEGEDDEGGSEEDEGKETSDEGVKSGPIQEDQGKGQEKTVTGKEKSKVKDPKEE